MSATCVCVAANLTRPEHPQPEVAAVSFGVLPLMDASVTTPYGSCRPPSHEDASCSVIGRQSPYPRGRPAPTGPRTG